MCPACIITIGGGLLFARNFGINNLFIIGVLTVFLSLATDVILRKINHGKVFFPYQRVVMTVVIMLVISLALNFIK